MKRSMIFFYMFLACNTYTIHDQERFLQANNWYRSGEYDKASVQYQEIKNKSFYVWYNLGCSWYAQGDNLKALIAWMHAQRYAPFTHMRNTIDVIALVQKELGQQQTPLWIQYRTLYTAFFSVFMIQLLSIICWFVFLLFRKWLYKQRSLFLLFFLLILSWSSITVALIYWQDKQKYGIILNDETSLYVGPNDRFHIQGTLLKGASVCIDKKEKGWYKVRDGKQIGWISEKHLEPIA